MPLLRALEPIRTPGPFAVTGLLPASVKPKGPKLTVDDVGQIEVPLTSAGAKVLINHSEYIREDKKNVLCGNDDHIYETARKHISFANDTLWTSTIRKVINKTSKKLDLGDEVEVTAEPRKLLMCQKGSSLEPHVM